ncbi:MAG TPA: ECF-type sigma factor [Candidatus Krumholzibacteria bacterium]|nr:ECF-type sigma factor [Candidatus Krumholzibacteria bacterium]
MDERSNLTRLLRAATGGDGAARDQLMSLVYNELRVVAERQLRSERPDHTLSPTALVHEAYLKLDRLDHLDWQNRAQFFAIAAGAMRRVLVDHAVARKRHKRGGGVMPLPLDEGLHVPDATVEQVLVLDDLLRVLEEREPRHARIVELRFFAGMTIEETAGALAVSPATVKRDWTLLRAWLQRELGA